MTEGRLLDDADAVGSLERATFAAMPPQRLQVWGDWLLGFDDGTPSRPRSAVPLQHGTPALSDLDAIERLYADAGQPTLLRLPEVDAFATLRQALSARGYRRAQPTQVQTAALSSLLGTSPAPHAVALADAPGADWARLFLQDEFDPVDGASRLGILRRAPQSVFGTVRIDGEVVALGSACLAEGWCGIHGMRTRAAWRGRGLASALLAAFAQAAQARGITRCFLQVDQGNTTAQALYRHRGFTTAWTYAYWRPGA